MDGLDCVLMAAGLGVFVNFIRALCLWLSELIGFSGGSIRDKINRIGDCIEVWGFLDLSV